MPHGAAPSASGNSGVRPVVLFTAVAVKVLPATSAIVFDPPAWLPRWISAIRPGTVAAVRFDESAEIRN